MDKNLWIHFFQESLSGTHLEWFYQLDGTKVRNWEELATAFYKQYQYNADLAPTRTQLQGMSLGSGEGFKEYAQKWRDLAGRVQPPLTDRELVDMFLGTLSGPFYNHLIGNSSAGFTDLILTGERIEAGIRSGKIQEAAPSDKKPHHGKKESNAVHGKKSRHEAGAIQISNPGPAQQGQGQQRKEKRQYTKINMSLDQALQQMLKAGLITLRAPLRNPNTSAPNYHPNDRCAYHSDSPGHTTDNCWPLKNKIQDMIDAGEIQFKVPKTPHVITAPLPKHG